MLDYSVRELFEKWSDRDVPIKVIDFDYDKILEDFIEEFDEYAEDYNLMEYEFEFEPLPENAEYEYDEENNPDKVIGLTIILQEDDHCDPDGFRDSSDYWYWRNGDVSLW